MSQRAIQTSLITWTNIHTLVASSDSLCFTNNIACLLSWSSLELLLSAAKVCWRISKLDMV